MLQSASSGAGLSSVFQPIVDTRRGTIVGYEALARFDGYGESDPEAWFAAARRYGSAEELEVAALRSALAARSALPRNCFLTVNVSPDLLTSPGVRRVWQAEGDLSGLIVELTEQAPVESYLALEPDLHRLRAAGALIAVDDAGSGYAGLGHLLALRPALIKLDRALVRDVDRDEARRALVEMIGTFASRIDAWLLAEGVERVGELDTLVGLGVPLVQGYCLARPAPMWAGIDGGVRLRLAARQTREEKRTVRDLVEPAPAVAHIGEASAAFRADAGLASVVIIDMQHRPLAVLESDASHLGVASPGLRVNLDTGIAEALQRAMTRERGNRFEPLLATDNAGRFVGLVRLERMIEAVTSAVPGQGGMIGGSAGSSL
jgi:EAL domain-containing protein (putative c-di-GMP-specific phosphodiesterase class I)